MSTLSTDLYFILHLVYEKGKMREYLKLSTENTFKLLIFQCMCSSVYNVSSYFLGCFDKLYWIASVGFHMGELTVVEEVIDRHEPHGWKWSPARSGRNAVVAGSLAQLGTTKPNTDQYSVVWIGAVIHVDSFSLFFPKIYSALLLACVYGCALRHICMPLQKIKQKLHVSIFVSETF